MYTLTVVNGTGSGRYAAGTAITITANAPPAGDVFNVWTGAVMSNSTIATTTRSLCPHPTSPWQRTMRPRRPWLRRSRSWWTMEPESGTYAPGTIVTITATPTSNGRVFVGWTGAVVTNPASPRTTLIMPAGRFTVQANFQTALRR